MTANPIHFEASLRAATAELERRYGLGQTQVCESVLADFPQLGERRDSVLELIYFEYVLSQDSRRPISDQDLQDRFPEYRVELQKILNVDRVFRNQMDTDAIEGRAVANDYGTSPLLRNGSPDEFEGFGDYELLERIGQGGMGVVYKARQRKLNRLVALKTIDTHSSLNPAAVARFQSEAELVAKLQHPNIVQVFEIGSQLGVPYFSMELVTGGTLAEATSERPLVPRIAAKIVETIARAVHYAHGQSIVHRDLKPSNILLSPSDRNDSVEIPTRPSLAILDTPEHSNRFEPKIADFGLAKYFEGALERTATQAMIGTPSYMAPELIDSDLGEVGPACDIYSLGAILYDALAGRPPFNAATIIETIQQVRNAEVIAPSRLQANIPLDLETICVKCLSKEPCHRYASALELADDLKRFRDGQPIYARSASAWEQGGKWARRNPAVACLIAVSCVAAMAMTGLWLYAESSLAKADRASELGSRAVYAQTIRLAQFDLKQGDWQSAISRLEETKPEYRKFEWNLLHRQASKPMFTQTTKLMPHSVVFSPNGKWIAAAQRGNFGTDVVGNCTVWDIETGSEVYCFGGHPAGVNAVRFSPDGQFIATGGVIHSDSNQAGGLNVWRVSDGLLHFSDENADVYSLSFSPDGKHLATGGYKGRQIGIYSMDEGSKVRNWTGHYKFVSDLAYSPDGNLLASVGRDGTLRVWSMVEGVPHPTIVGDNAFDDLRHVEWAKDGREIIASDYHRAIYQFEVRTDGRIIQTGLTESAGINTIRVSPDDQYLATAGDGGVPLITDRVTKAVLGSVNCFGHTFDIAFDRPGRRVAVASGYKLQIWDLAHCLYRSTLHVSSNPDVVALDRHPVEDKVALAYGVNIRKRSNQSGSPRFEIVDMTTNRVIKSMEHGKDWPSCVAFAPDGHKIVSGDEGGIARLWNANDGTRTHEIAAHDGNIVGVVLPAFANEFITCGGDQWLRSWSMTTGAQTRSLKLEETPLRFSGGRRTSVFALQTASYIHVFDSPLLKAMGAIPIGDNSISAMKLSEDGSWLAIADDKNTISIWDLAGLTKKGIGEPLWRMRGHTYGINDLTFSSDNTRLASTSTDMTVRLWDTTSGRELINLPILSQGMNPLIVFSKDDTSVQVWDMSHHFHWKASHLDDSRDRVADRDWHNEQLLMARRANRKLELLAVPNRFAEEFHLTRLMELDPLGNWRQQRGKVRCQMGDLQGSYDDFLAVYQRQVPDLKTTQAFVSDGLKSLANTTTWKNPKSAFKKLTAPLTDMPLLLSLAKCALGLGKIDEYRQWCQELKAGYEANKNLVYLNNYAWAAGLDASSDSDWKQIRLQFEKFGAKVLEPTYLNTRALIEYRSSDYNAALKSCDLAAKKALKTNVPLDWIIAGMCYVQQSKREAAQRMRARVAEWSAEQELLRSENLKGFGTAEFNPVPTQVLLKELDHLLNEMSR